MTEISDTKRDNKHMIYVGVERKQQGSWKVIQINSLRYERRRDGLIHVRLIMVSSHGIVNKEDMEN